MNRVRYRKDPSFTSREPMRKSIVSRVIVGGACRKTAARRHGLAKAVHENLSTNVLHFLPSGLATRGSMGLINAGWPPSRREVF